MCLQVYVASGVPLPASGEPGHPPFHVRAVMETEAAVRKLFSKPHVYYIGAHDSCGCGFHLVDRGEVEEGEQLARVREARRLLVQYLKKALERQQEIELLACWEGDGSGEAKRGGALRPDDLLESRDHFHGKELMTIAERAG